MKKIIALGGIFCFALLVKTNTGGPGWALTNAPVSATSNESNCTNCHSSFALQTSGSNFNRINLTNNFTGNGYIPDSTYTFILGYKETGKSKFGFQLTCLEEKTYKAAGTFTNGDSRSQTGTSVVGGSTRYYLGHTSTGSASVSTDSTAWRFTWKAPARNVGKIVFWVTLNVTNSSSGSSGDYVYSKSFTFSPSTLLPTAKAKITDVNICSNTQLNFAADVTGSPTNYSWSFPSGTPSSSTSATPKITYTNSGNFIAILSVRNNKGPSANDTLRFTVKPSPALPVISPSTNQSICAGDSVRLSITPVAGISYRWSPKGQTTSSIFVKDSGFYSVTATASNGCSRNSASTIKVVVNPVPEIQINSNLKNDSVCVGNTFSLNLRKLKNPADSFSFVSVNGPWTTDTSIQINNAVAGKNDYSAWVKSKAGCRSQANKSIVAVSKIAGPQLSTDSKTIKGFKVSWTGMPGVSGYMVSEDSGKTYKNPSSGFTGLEHLVTGMTAGKKREIQVKAVLNGLCGESQVSSIVGETDTCSAVGFNLSLSQPKVCIGGSSILTVGGLNGRKVNVKINGTVAGTDTAIVLKPTKTEVYSIEILDINKADCGYYGPKNITLQVDSVPVTTDLSGNATYIQCSKTGTESLKVTRTGGNSDDSLIWFQNGSIAASGMSTSHTYSIKNNDLIWLKVKTKLGCINEGSKTKTILVPVPTAGFTYQNNGTVYTFTANDTNGTHEWKGPAGLSGSGGKAIFDLTSQAGKSVKIYHKHVLNGCEGNDSVQISVQLQNVNVFGKNAWLKVYPNPATDKIEVQTSGRGQIQITNSEGRLVLTDEILESKKLNVYNLNSGIYTISFRTENGYSQTRFVILK